MTDQQDTSTVTSQKKKSGSKAKLVFILVLVAAALLVLRIQRNPSFSGWGKDLDAALRRAAQENRPVLVFFTAQPPSQITRRLLQTTLSKAANKQAIEQGRFIMVRVKLDTSLDEPLAKRYGIKTLPTMLVLDKRGREVNRREGMIGELDFRKGFLDASRVLKR